MTVAPRPIDPAGYAHIRFAREDNVLIVTMDNPPLNAASFGLHQELSQVFYDLAHDPCRIVVLTGEGRAFSAGGDFDDMLRNCDDTHRQALLLERGPHIVRSMLALGKPLIGRVNGHAMGLGATLAVLCDISIMAEGARIGDPHVNIGMSAGDGGALLWPLLVGFARARFHLLTGAALSAREAAEIGLIHKAVPLDKLDDEVNSLIGTLSGLAPAGVNGTKRSINLLLQTLCGGLVEAHIGLEQISMNTADHKEALQALKEKRPAVFS